MVRVHVEQRGEGRGLEAGGSGERRSFPAAWASALSASSVSVGCVRCEMDNALLSGSDSDSEDSFVTDKEVGVSRAGRELGAGGGLIPPVLTADPALQLQDAFSRGLLKPGLNAVLEAPKKAVNDVVSSGARSGARNGWAWVAEFLSKEGRNMRIVKRVHYLLRNWGLALCRLA